MRCAPVIIASILLASTAWAEPVAIVGLGDEGFQLRTKDGDTLVLEGLLAPPPDGREAEIARAALQDVVAGANAFRATYLTDGEDRWRLRPADVFADADDTALQDRMLRDGHARIAPCPRGGPERLARLRAAEQDARAAERGLWRLDAYKSRAADEGMQARGYHIVEGAPVATGGGRKMRYLNFAKNWREDFTLRMERRLLRSLEAAGLAPESLIGRRIRARGWLFYANGPMLHVACPQQIEVLEQ